MFCEIWKTHTFFYFKQLCRVEYVILVHFRQFHTFNFGLDHSGSWPLIQLLVDMHPQSWQLLSSFCRFNLQRCWLPHSADGITSHLLWAWHWKLLPNSVQQWFLSLCRSFDRSAHHWFHFPWKWWEHQLCHQWVCNSISKACLFTPRLATYSLQFFNFALKKWGGGSLVCCVMNEAPYSSSFLTVIPDPPDTTMATELGESS